MVKNSNEVNQKKETTESKSSSGLNYKIAVPLAIIAGGFGSLYVYFHRTKGENNPFNKLPGGAYVKAVFDAASGAVDLGISTVKNAFGKVGDTFQKLNPWSKVVETRGGLDNPMVSGEADSSVRLAFMKAIGVDKDGVVDFAINAGNNLNPSGAVLGGAQISSVAGAFDNLGDGAGSSTDIAASAAAAIIARTVFFVETVESEDSVELEEPVEEVIASATAAATASAMTRGRTLSFEATEEREDSAELEKPVDEVVASDDEEESVHGDGEASDHDDGEVSSQEGDIAYKEESDDVAADLLLSSVLRTPERENQDNSEEELTPYPVEALIPYVDPKDQPFASVLGITGENES